MKSHDCTCRGGVRIRLLVRVCVLHNLLGKYMSQSREIVNYSTMLSVISTMLMLHGYMKL